MKLNGFPGLPAVELESRGAAWTAREIAQQPAVWNEVVVLLGRERERLDAFLAPLLADPSQRIVLTGAGTSAFIGDCLAPALSVRPGRRAEAIASTDLLTGPATRLASASPTLLVSFARSGDSPESVAVLELAERLLAGRVRHLVITCNRDGALALRAGALANARVLVMPDATHDRGFAMTSSFSAMLLAAALTFRATGTDAVIRLASRAETVLPRAAKLAEGLVERRFERVVYLGSNELRGLASEAALKLLELSDGRIVATAESTLGFRHGPKTILNGRTLVVVLLSNDAYTRAYDVDLLQELARDGRAGHLLALAGREDGATAVERLVYAGMGDAPDLELVPMHALFAQSFALLQSLALGLTPDRPDATGTVNRVVQGVTIHPWNGTGNDVPRR
jgi:D-galactosamine 6-phosphate deaminase/isomerase